MEIHTNSNATQGKNLTPSYIDVTDKVSEHIIEVKDMEELLDEYETFNDQMARIRNTTGQKRNAYHTHTTTTTTTFSFCLFIWLSRFLKLELSREPRVIPGTKKQHFRNNKSWVILGITRPKLSRHYRQGKLRINTGQEKNSRSLRR